MATVKDLLAIKGPRVLTIGSTASALDAALLMNEHKVGGLVVMSEGKVAGIITERDILQRIVAQRRDAAQTAVQDVMTAEVVCCLLTTSIEEARGVMKHRRIRHLPVVNEAKQLCGIISIGDLNAYETSSHEMTIHVLQQYIYGRA
jgi:CBS domain-containing protein